MDLIRTTAVAFLIIGLCPTLWGQETIAPSVVREWQVTNKPFNFVDVRSTKEFRAKHITGAVNVPHNHILEAGLPKKGTLVLYCAGEGCALSPAAGGELVQNGYKKVFVLDGGLAAWEAQGHPIVAVKPAAASVSAGRVSPRDLSKRMKKGETVIVDVRPAAEFSAGHLPGALNFPLETLEGRLEELDKAKPIVVYDRLPDRSRKAGELLLQKGYSVEEMAGGIAVWIAMKLPVEM